MVQDTLPVADHATARPADPLRPFIHRYTGYRYSGLLPGVHRGLPSPSLALIISLEGTTRLTAMPDPAQPPGEFVALVGGLHTAPAIVAHDGALAGVQIDLTPAGARSLLGVPTGEMGPRVIALEDILGPGCGEIVERVRAAPDWSARFAALDAMFVRRMGRLAPAERPLTGAWEMILHHGGNVAVSEVAREVGWSRRQLGERFAREYGVTVKDAARVIRFHRSRLLLQHRPGLTIGSVAAASGYCDQAHMAREWRRLAGCSPSAWLGTEELPFIQDLGESEAAD